jgi:hypothetical protein
MVTDSSGNYSAIWRPYHYIGLELAQSIYSIALDKRATGFTKKYNADVASYAKKDLMKFINALVVKLVDTKDLKSLPLAECQFESGRGHHFK